MEGQKKREEHCILTKCSGIIFQGSFALFMRHNLPKCDAILGRRIRKCLWVGLFLFRVGKIWVLSSLRYRRGGAYQGVGGRRQGRIYPSVHHPSGRDGIWHQKEAENDTPFYYKRLAHEKLTSHRFYKDAVTLYFSSNASLRIVELVSP